MENEDEKWEIYTEFMVLKLDLDKQGIDRSGLIQGWIL
jgi:hypothetical protein